MAWERQRRMLLPITHLLLMGEPDTDTGGQEMRGESRPSRLETDNWTVLVCVPTSDGRRTSTERLFAFRSSHMSWTFFPKLSKRFDESVSILRSVGLRLVLTRGNWPIQLCLAVLQNGRSFLPFSTGSR